MKQRRNERRPSARATGCKGDDRGKRGPVGGDGSRGGAPRHPGLLFVALPVPRGAFVDETTVGDDATTRALDFVLRTSHISLHPIAMGGLH